MNYKEYLEKESECSNTLYIEFIQLKKKTNIIHCFFEGEDFKYYSSRINMYTEEEETVYQYDCKGKDKVLETYNLIRNGANTNGVKMLFFIDSDFDDNSELVNNDIYITPGYAVENFYIHDKVMEQFLSSELKIGRTSHDENDKKDFESAMKKYKEERSKFIRDSTILNVWYSLQKRKSKGLNNCEYPDLKKLKKFYALDQPITIETLQNNTENYIKVDMMEIEDEKKRLLKDPLNLFRGKYYFEFMSTIINKYCTNDAVKENIFIKRRKCKSNISENNIISELSQYAETPRCLKNYLNSRLNICVKKSVS